MSEKEKAKRRGPGPVARVLERAAATLIVLAVLAVAAYTLGPGVVERLFGPREQVTIVEVEHRLEAIGELATYSMSYTGNLEHTSARQVFGWNVPGTRNRVRISYSGIIKVGYRVDEIGVDVDTQERVIHIVLPEPIVISNTIDEDSLRYEQTNNIFNPLSGDLAESRLEDARREELRRAEALGLYDLARENAERIIGDSLSIYEDYRVLFE